MKRAATSVPALRRMAADPVGREQLTRWHRQILFNLDSEITPGQRKEAERLLANIQSALSRVAV